MPKIVIRGLKQLEEKLKAMDEAYSVNSLRRVVAEGAEMIRAEAELNARRFFKVRTGNLLKSLVARVSKNPNIASAYAKSMQRTAPHAHLLEYGHRTRKSTQITKQLANGKTATAWTHFVPGRPFFRPAIDSQRSKIRRMIQTQMMLAMERVLAGKNSPGFGPEDTGWAG